LINLAVEYIFNQVVDRSLRKRERDQRLDGAFFALADSTRRQIVEMLREAQRLRVGDIAGAFSISLNAISKHLKVLESAGLVRREIVGREHWIAVDWSGLERPHQWLEYHRHFWNERLDALVDSLENKDRS